MNNIEFRELYEGVKVSHPRYGEGIIVQVDEDEDEPDETTILVGFLVPEPRRKFLEEYGYRAGLTLYIRWFGIQDQSMHYGGDDEEDPQDYAKCLSKKFAGYKPEHSELSFPQ